MGWNNRVAADVGAGRDVVVAEGERGSPGLLRTNLGIAPPFLVMSTIYLRTIGRFVPVN